MNLSTNGRMNLTAKGGVHLTAGSSARPTFSLGGDFHITVWKTMFPLVLLVTLCVCIPHRVGVI